MEVQEGGVAGRARAGDSPSPVRLTRRAAAGAGASTRTARVPAEAAAARAACVATGTVSRRCGGGKLCGGGGGPSRLPQPGDARFCTRFRRGLSGAPAVALGCMHVGQSDAKGAGGKMSVDALVASLWRCLRGAGKGIGIEPARQLRAIRRQVMVDLFINFVRGRSDAPLRFFLAD